MIKYTFWPNSVTGLNHTVHVEAMDYVHAKNLVLKMIYKKEEHLHLKKLHENKDFW